jgi:hypothetical protein
MSGEDPFQNACELTFINFSCSNGAGRTMQIDQPKWKGASILCWTCNTHFTLEDEEKVTFISEERDSKTFFGKSISKGRQLFAVSCPTCQRQIRFTVTLKE